MMPMCILGFANGHTSFIKRVGYVTVETVMSLLAAVDVIQWSSHDTLS